MSGAPLLDVRGLHTVFDTRDGAVPAVSDLSFTLGRGRVLGLVGESGSGKSVTGFSIMGLLDAPGRIAGGQVLFDGQDLVGLPPARLRQLHGRRIAMIFQDPMMTLNPVLRVETQMIEAVRAHRRCSRAAAREQARDALARVGIPSPEDRLRAYPHQLSGGMRQRVAIAIAMLHRPDLIIADEPTTALDVTIQAQILNQMQRLVREQGTALIWISHDLSVVAGLADDIAVMYAGRLVEHGDVDTVIDRPAHPYTRGLLDSLPANTPRGERLSQIAGIAPDLARLPPGCAFAPRCARADAACAAQPPFAPLPWDVPSDADAGTGRAADIAAPRRVRCFHPIAAGQPVHATP
ncbi:ABC transporter ATP-binding protein [Achromobacter aloeverae]